ncbi:hypothetical protein C900_03161 [Fulvivirga imtechensis AK7]|uniref:Uncharacterized protein n=1 Tax=Fulvivirga imtechensis AK7 TaxID=1237149 RepID=L8JPZ2_9BACT|nr:hypothetical protein C900_03161 [Fulvivirga imtechensis AK7]
MINPINGIAAIRMVIIQSLTDIASVLGFTPAGESNVVSIGDISFG